MGFACKIPECFGICLVTTLAMMCIAPGDSAAAATQEIFPCRQKLSKKGAMIFDDVLQKRTADSSLEEVWKEVTRDLITANRLGREEATTPAMEALNCLRAPK